MPKAFEKRSLHALLYPKPATIDWILASENPVSEAERRLAHCPWEQRTPTEKRFSDSAFFLGVTLNDGLDGALLSSAGDAFYDVLAFVREYGSDELAHILEKVEALFPGGVSTSKEERAEVVEPFLASVDNPFDQLTTELYTCEAAFWDALLESLRTKPSEFPWVSSPDLLLVGRDNEL